MDRIDKFVCKFVDFFFYFWGLDVGLARNVEIIEDGLLGEEFYGNFKVPSFKIIGGRICWGDFKVLRFYYWKWIFGMNNFTIAYFLNICNSVYFYYWAYKLN